MHHLLLGTNDFRKNHINALALLRMKDPSVKEAVKTTSRGISRKVHTKKQQRGSITKKLKNKQLHTRCDVGYLASKKLHPESLEIPYHSLPQ